MAKHPKGFFFNHSNPIMDSFRSVADTQRQVGEITETAKQVLKEHYKSAEELAQFIEKQGTPVFVLPPTMSGWMVRLGMLFLGYDPGFVVPSVKGDASSKRYEVLVDLLRMFLGDGVMDQKLQVTGQVSQSMTFAKGMFVMPKKIFEVGFIAHQLHHWLAFLSGLSGYGVTDQSWFKKFLAQPDGIAGMPLEKMSYEEVHGLQQAIRREMEALQFIKSVILEIIRPAYQAKHFADGNTQA